MLTELTIKQLGVIEAATMAPGRGLTVVTGETGAGKTMVVSGLGLIAGARADTSTVRNRQGTALVEARFTDLSPQVWSQIEAAGGLAEEGELLITRQVAVEGRSRCWIGGAGVTGTTLAQVGAELVTIHGQSEQVRLSTPERQRQVLDRAAGPELAVILADYRQLYEERRQIGEELELLSASARERARELDMLTYGLDEIDKVAPSAGEDEALASEAKRLQDADDLRRLAFTAMVALAGDEAMDVTSVVTLVAQARRALAQAALSDERAQGLAGAVEEIAVLATDLAGGVANYLADLAADPLRLEWIESRLAELKGLTRKYGANATAVLAWAAEAQARLGELELSDERIDQLTARLEALDGELAERAERIRQLRSAAAAIFAEQVAAELIDLAMPNARVEFALTPLAELGPYGGDGIAMLFTANPGSEPAPLGRVASGGELSRVRLAIEVVLADASEGATFIFDEVDAGIGGIVGLQVGLRLARLARQGQVIVVTHLAQVAAFASTHYVVRKTDDGEVTASDLTEVRDTERRMELARMMGGLDSSATSLAHARELEAQAQSMMAAS
ncbi:MAG: DNA repair protein RecN [Propionibacteriaceae bacterium]|jgi:DNA repair protein RecN (Recombination protein N)|nr:DNA repair protein RecN [Propionibacteriaceae bacterium]